MKGLRARGSALALGAFAFAAASTLSLTAGQAVTNTTVDPSLYRAVYYRPLSVFSRGGRVTAVTGVPSTPGLFYMGAAGGGVWRTRDSGAPAGPLPDGQNLVRPAGAIPPSPPHPDLPLPRPRAPGPRRHAPNRL